MKKFFKNPIKAITLSVLLTFTLQAHASGHHDHLSAVDKNTPIPKLESMHQLGELNFKMPDIQQFYTDNGVAVLFTRLHELPMVDISVSFLSGSSRDESIKKEAFGLASMTATMLTQGTQTHSEESFIAKTEQLAIELGASANKDRLSVNLRSLSDKNILDPAVLLLIDTMTKPAFDGDTLKRNQIQTITAIKQSEQRANYVARQAFDKAVFGNHPYANPSIGTITSVERLTRDDLLAYKNKYLVADNAKIIITGDLSLDNAKKIANTIAKALPKGEKAQALPTPNKPKAQHIHINHPSNQINVIIGHLGEKINTDSGRMQEFSDLRLGNEILAGGDFNARLMDFIREQKGYTYGIYGNFARMEHSGHYTVSFSTKSELAQNAIADTLMVIKNTLKDGIKQDELSLAVQNNKNSFPAMFAGNGKIHQVATMLNVNDLPISYLSDSLKRYDQANIDSVNRSLTTHIKPDDFVIITVGDKTPVLSH